MEQIVRTYGKFLLDVAVVISLFGLIFVQMTDEAGNRGFFHIAGAHLVAADMEESIPKDFSVYQMECTKSPPVISFVGEGMLHRGYHTVTDFIKAADYNGRELPIQLLGCWDVAGQELLNVNRQMGEVFFEKAGIYTLKVKAVDEENRSDICSIKLAVND